MFNNVNNLDNIVEKKKKMQKYAVIFGKNETLDMVYST